jgi:glycosyltransferase involved in cell wall biosynthesis
MKVLTISTWNTACGVAEETKYIKEALAVVAPDIEMTVESTLHPDFAYKHPAPDLLFLPYHAALHSQWTPAEILKYQGQVGVPVVLLYHDSGVPSTDQCKALHAVADAFLIHEEPIDLPGAHVVPMGIPPFRGQSWTYHPRRPEVEHAAYPSDFLRTAHQPILGSIGFPFPWKNYDLLAETTGECGWALLLIAPNATEEQVARWTKLNPDSRIITRFLPTQDALAALAGCDATAFCYVCQNAGISAAIRQGIAVGKPVLAADGCRQFRDLADGDWHGAIRWFIPNKEGLSDALDFTFIGKCSPRVLALAEAWSWEKSAAQIATIFRTTLERTRP